MRKVMHKLIDENASYDCCTSKKIQDNVQKVRNVKEVRNVQKVDDVQEIF